MTLTEVPGTADLASSEPAPAVEPEGATPTTTAPRQPGLNASTLALCALFVAMFAFIAALFAIGLASRALDRVESQPAATAAAGAAGPAEANITLTEFQISPNPVKLGTGGGVLRIRNGGSVVHNLKVEGRQSPDVASGGETTLDVKGLADGQYTMICAIPGHEASGMKATLVVG